MKRFVFLMALLCCAMVVNGKVRKPVNLIFDTDIAPDYDDVGAMAVLHALADNNEVNILATVSSNKCWTTVPCLNVINTFYGRPDIPIAVAKGEVPDRNTWHKGLRWTEELPKRYPHADAYKSSDNAEDALTFYRRLLSEQPNRSVTIVTVGFFTNLQKLLLSGPDKYSPLTGRELVKKKVKKLVSMAGHFPEGREYNVYIDTKASQFIIKEWPTDILFSGFEIGSKILTGKRLAASGIKGNPIIDTYSITLAQDNPKGRESWDQTATLVAVRGAEPYFEEVRGTMVVHDDGSNTWIPSKKGHHSHLVFKMTPEEVTRIIEDLMLQQPKKK